MARAAQPPRNFALWAPRLYRLLRLGTGALLLYAGMAKLFAPLGFYEAVLHYRLLPGSASAFLSAVLPWVEVVLGTALLLDLCAPGAWLAACALLGAFATARAMVVLQGTTAPCGCAAIPEPVSSWQGVALTTALAALAVLGLWRALTHRP